VLRKRVEANSLGKKTGSGFYHYKKGKAVRDRDADLGNQGEIQNRLMYRLLNEAASCLREGIVDDEELLDAGVIFGTGFAPFTGGPMNYARHTGLQTLENALQAYQQRFGERFKPDAGWTTFY
jgi:3-hydroxyacyl-CoA dehydrogenase/enoyl-CoA hydratase/3-hydroxybutyryl-CoA epimerase